MHIIDSTCAEFDLTPDRYRHFIFVHSTPYIVQSTGTWVPRRTKKWERTIPITGTYVLLPVLCTCTRVELRSTYSGTYPACSIQGMYYFGELHDCITVQGEDSETPAPPTLVPPVATSHVSLRLSDVGRSLDPGSGRQITSTPAKLFFSSHTQHLLTRASDPESAAQPE